MDGALSTHTAAIIPHVCYLHLIRHTACCICRRGDPFSSTREHWLAIAKVGLASDAPQAADSGSSRLLAITNLDEACAVDVATLVTAPVPNGCNWQLNSRARLGKECRRGRLTLSVRRLSRG
jgi:hypothetical protein